MDDELKGLLGQVLTKLGAIQAGQDGMRGDISALQAGQDGMRGDISALQAGQDALREDVSVVQSGLEELRRVTSVNHFRVMGRIEQLSVQLDRHLASPHGAPNEGRKSA